MKELIKDPYFWGTIEVVILFSILIFKTVKLLIEVKNEDTKRNI